MINQKKAFNRFTTAKHLLEVYQEGHYDEKNNWTGDTYLPGKMIRCTPIPYGDRDSGIGGQKLMATDVGERQPAFMRIHSRTIIPIKSLITVYGLKYKVIEKDDVTDAGFNVVIAAKVLEK
ncbi:head protein [Pantoea phage vB_PagM_SSEM1]|uniref:Structural protein n=1 Tax=Pantoea phage vB_PagM_SSEM1 TaxID=2721760 RepID=A0A6H0DBN2_9CAUD|nr:head protein [Pantoea phage vB_PagM_SSEM1]QIS79335.1 structural protein [Pantoea phage vB_PagM_SSEM1]